jgi:hypothetical protein
MHVRSRDRGADTTALENAVKATYLYKFAPFVAWPPSAFGDPADPITICVAGDGAAGNDPAGEDSVEALLSQAAVGQSADGRPIAVRHLTRTDALKACQILYAAGPRAERVAVLDEARAAPVLTVTDGADGDAGKGIINFVIQENRVRFQVDVGLATRAGLTISSKLLSLAVAGGPKS